ncbi:MAG: EMC3/TMCO1 family protein [Candidatus Woesearchaeota archaeon]
MVLDALLGWSLQMDLWLGLFLLALIITVLMNAVYYFVTDQKEMRRLKGRIKDLQADMKKHRDNQKKVMQLQKNLLKLNGEYTKKSLKPTLYTLIPILIVFGWMAANLAFAPVLPGEEVVFVVEMREPAILTLVGDVQVDERTKETIERERSWRISASSSVNFSVQTQEGESITRELVISSIPSANVESHDAPFRRSTIEYGKATPFGGFSMFGYRPGWLFTYILYSIVLSILIRKVFRIS